VTRPTDIAAVVAFYGTSGGKFEKSEAAYLGHFAEHDPFESATAVAGLEKRLRGANSSRIQGRDTGSSKTISPAHTTPSQPRRPGHDRFASCAST